MSDPPPADFGYVYEGWPTDRLRRAIAQQPSYCHPAALAAMIGVLDARGVTDGVAALAGQPTASVPLNVHAVRRIFDEWATDRLLRAATEDAHEYHPLALASIVEVLQARGIDARAIDEFAGDAEPTAARNGDSPAAPPAVPEDPVASTRRLVHRLVNELLDVRADRRAAWLERQIPNDPALRARVLASIPIEFDPDPASDSIRAGAERARPVADDQPVADAAARPPVADALIDARLGPWRVIERLAHQGGMSTVYRGERADGAYRQQVAIKVIPQSPDTQTFLQRFERERHVLARLEHPFVVRILDAGTTLDGRPYLVMEWVNGERLDDYIDRAKPNLPTRLELFLSICQAIQYAHQGLIVHRDLKPANILVAADGTPKVLDFGLATLLAAEHTPLATLFRSKTGDGGFTIEYASPEQIRGQRVTTATDVYALGMVLFELLTGRYPFAVAGKTPWEISEIVCKETPLHPSLATLDQAQTGDRVGVTPGIAARHLRGDLDEIVLHALRKEPEGRYQTARELADDISRFLKKEPVLARRQFGYGARRFLQRHVLVVSALLTIIATLAVALFLVGRSNAETSAALASTRENLANALILQSQGADVSPRRSLELVRRALEQAPGNRAARYHLARLIEQAAHRTRRFTAVRFATIDRTGQQILVADGQHVRLLTLTLEDVASATHVGPVSAMAFDADSNRLAVGSRDGQFTVWHITNGTAAPRFAREPGAGVTGLAFLTGGDLIVASGQTLERWSPGGTLIDRRTVAGEVICLAPDGRHALVDTGRQWTVVTVATGTRRRAFDVTDVTDAAFSATGEHLTLRTANGTLRRYAGDQWKEITSLVGATTESADASGTRPLLGGAGYVYFRGDDGRDARGAVALPPVSGLASHPDLPLVVAWVDEAVAVWEPVAESAIGAEENGSYDYSRVVEQATRLAPDGTTVDFDHDHLLVTDANERELARIPFAGPEPDTLAIAREARVVAAYRSTPRDAVTFVWTRQANGSYVASEVSGRLLALSDDGQTVAVTDPVLMLRDVTSGIPLQRLEPLPDAVGDRYLTRVGFLGNGSLVARYGEWSDDVFVLFRTWNSASSVASSDLLEQAAQVLDDRVFDRTRVSARSGAESQTTLFWRVEPPAQRCRDGCCRPKVESSAPGRNGPVTLRVMGFSSDDTGDRRCDDRLQLSMPGALLAAEDRYLMDAAAVDGDGDGRVEVVWITGRGAYNGAAGHAHILVPGPGFDFETGGIWHPLVSFTLLPRSASFGAIVPQHTWEAVVFRDLDGDGRRETICHVIHGSDIRGGVAITGASRVMINGTIRSIAASACGRPDRGRQVMIDATDSGDAIVRDYPLGQSPFDWATVTVTDER